MGEGCVRGGEECASHHEGQRCSAGLGGHGPISGGQSFGCRCLTKRPVVDGGGLHASAAGELNFGLPLPTPP